MRDPNKDRHEILHGSVKDLAGPGPCSPKEQRALEERLRRALRRKDGSPIPQDAVIFTVGEIVDVKGCKYKIANIDRKGLRLISVKPQDIEEGRPA